MQDIYASSRWNLMAISTLTAVLVTGSAPCGGAESSGMRLLGDPLPAYVEHISRYGLQFAQANQPGPGLPGQVLSPEPGPKPAPATIPAARPPVPGVGNLQVVVQVPEARVYVDGQYVGSASRNEPLNEQGFLSGTVEVRVEADGYQPFTTPVQIRSYEWTQLPVRLELSSPPARVVRAEPSSGADDDSVIGSDPRVAPMTEPDVPLSSRAVTTAEHSSMTAPQEEPEPAVPMVSPAPPVPAEGYPRNRAPVACTLRPCDTHWTRTYPR